MAIIVNNLQISGTASANNYIQGDWIQNDSSTSMSFNYLGVKNSTVSGGASPGWYANTGGIDFGNNVGWIFSSVAPPSTVSPGNFFFFFS